MSEPSSTVRGTVDVERMRQKARSASALLKAMGNERRLMILFYLLQAERSVSELQELIGISQSALSQHLARLRADSLVSTRRRAQSIYYSVSDASVGEIAMTLQRIFAAR